MSAKLIAALATSLVLASCAGGTETQERSVAPKTPTTSAQAAEATTGTTITTGDSEFGTMLFDDRNQAIYMFELETSSTPACYDDCAVAWPPVLTNGEPVAAGEVDPALLGTTKRTDGHTQVTYNDHPLYYYVNEGPGEVLCHNVYLNGGLWWVVQPDGNPAP